MTQKSISPKGKRLTREQAEAIIADPRVGTDVAKAYGLSGATVSNIRAGLTWKSLDRSRQPERPKVQKRSRNVKYGYRQNKEEWQAYLDYVGR